MLWIKHIGRDQKVISLAKNNEKYKTKDDIVSKKFLELISYCNCFFFVFENRFTASNRQSEMLK
jgi:hypothetical protein